MIVGGEQAGQVDGKIGGTNHETIFLVGPPSPTPSSLLHDVLSLPVYVLLRSSTETLAFWSEGIELLTSDIYGEKFEVTYPFQPSVETTLDFLRMPSFSYSPLTEPTEIYIQRGNEGSSLTDLIYTFQANVEYEIVVSFPENFNAYFFTDSFCFTDAPTMPKPPSFWKAPSTA